MLCDGDVIWYTDGNRTHYAYVHWQASASCDTRQLVQWLADMRAGKWCDFLSGEVELILDKAPWHTSHLAQRLFEEKENANLHPHYIPTAGGRWINPCDQTIHHDLRQAYRRLQLERPGRSLQNLISAFYSITESSIHGSWKATCLLEGNLKRMLLRRAAEGYQAPVGRAQLFESYLKKFMEWGGLRYRKLTDALPDHRPLDTDGTQLDGRYHRTYAPNHKKRKG